MQMYAVCTYSDAGPQAPAKLQREDWMTMPLGPSDRALSLLSLRGQESEKERQKKADMEKVVSLCVCVCACVCIMYGGVHPWMCVSPSLSLSLSLCVWSVNGNFAVEKLSG